MRLRGFLSPSSWLSGHGESSRGSGCTVGVGVPLPVVIHLDLWKASAGVWRNMCPLSVPGFGWAFSLLTSRLLDEIINDHLQMEKDKLSKHLTPTAAGPGAADVSSPTFHGPPSHVYAPGPCDLAMKRQRKEGASVDTGDRLIVWPGKSWWGRKLMPIIAFSNCEKEQAAPPPRLLTGAHLSMHSLPQQIQEGPIFQGIPYASTVSPTPGAATVLIVTVCWMCLYACLCLFNTVQVSILKSADVSKRRNHLTLGKEDDPI